MPDHTKPRRDTQVNCRLTYRSMSRLPPRPAAECGDRDGSGYAIHQASNASRHQCQVAPVAPWRSLIWRSALHQADLDAAILSVSCGRIGRVERLVLAEACR